MLIRTQFAVEQSLAHIASLPAANMESAAVKSYLATYCAFLFCSEMENSLSGVLNQKLSEVMVGRIANFITSTNKGMLKRVNKSDIAKFIEHFGEDAKQEFNTLLGAREVQTYMNVVTARHDNAHGESPVSVTLEDIAAAIPVANSILSSIGDIIAKP